VSCVAEDADQLTGVRKMKRVPKTLVVLAAGVSGIALVASATGASTGGVKVIRPHGLVVALAIEGGRVAYDAGSVAVWNTRSGKTTTVSGRQTAGDGNVLELAIAGSQVAWQTNAFGNSESDDYLFTSSLSKPKERLVAKAFRYGDACGAAEGPGACVGPWISGVVASGNRILVNRWRTNSSGSITHAGLYALNGARFTPVATGAGTVRAVAADPKHVAVLHPDGTISLYSAAGRSLLSVTPTAQSEEVALNGRNLLVLEPKGTLALYDANTGSLRKTFTLHGNPDPLWQGALFCRVQCNIAVQGNIAVYSTPVRSNADQVITESAIRALNLTTGKDRPVGRLPGQINLTRIDSTGLVYTNSNWTDKNGFENKLVFVPFKQVAAAVS
jgi:WD40 repeat protein